MPDLTGMCFSAKRALQRALLALLCHEGDVGYLPMVQANNPWDVEVDDFLAENENEKREAPTKPPNL